MENYLSEIRGTWVMLPAVKIGTLNNRATVARSASEGNSFRLPRLRFGLVFGGE